MVLNQIELFYNTNKQEYIDFKIGEKVKLKKGYFIHGIRGNLEQFDLCVRDGFISSNFNGIKNNHKLYNNVGFWNIKEDILLEEYIKNYSGCTIGYNIGLWPDVIKKAELVPFGLVENKMIELNNNPKVWAWYCEQTKEIRFLPSLCSEKNQIAFILNTADNENLIYADLFNKAFKKNILKYFVVKKCLNSMLNDDLNAFTTDRESAIMFGLPSSLIVGVLVGRELEKDSKSVEYIKSKLPKAFICNLDGIIMK